jgi:hypothetical protein
MNERQIQIIAVSSTELKVGCSFPTIAQALAALDAARRKIAAGEVPMGNPAANIQVVNKMPENLK